MTHSTSTSPSSDANSDEFAGRRIGYSKLGLSTVLPQNIAVELRAAALSAASKGTDSVGKQIDTIVLAADTKDPGRHWQRDQIEFLKNPYSTASTLCKKRARKG